MNVTDRRTSGGESLGNRQRFLKRARGELRKRVAEQKLSGGISDVTGQENRTFKGPFDGTREPIFSPDLLKGKWNRVLPGNDRYGEGDIIPRPSGEGSGGSGNLGGIADEAVEDAFAFTLTEQEFSDLLFEDMELPDLVKRGLDIEHTRLKQAGFKSDGAPNELALIRTLKHARMGHIALGRPSMDAIEALAEAISEVRTVGGDETVIETMEAELLAKQALRGNLPFITSQAVRYRNRTRVAVPITQAVMFCLMDVSASMSEYQKDLAKRFFWLLNLFLKRKYQRVQVRFIRHTDTAGEVDERTFFYGKDTGGTVVSTALKKTVQLIKDCYNPANWNVYVAQASDGDNVSGDGEQTKALMAREILPACQYAAYLEISERSVHARSDLWKTYESIPAASDSRSRGGSLAMCQAFKRSEIYPVLRSLFEREHRA